MDNTGLWQEWGYWKAFLKQSLLCLLGCSQKHAVNLPREILGCAFNPWSGSGVSISMVTGVDKSWFTVILVSWLEYRSSPPSPSWDDSIPIISPKKYQNSLNSKSFYFTEKADKLEKKKGCSWQKKMICNSELLKKQGYPLILISAANTDQWAKDSARWKKDYSMTIITNCYSKFIINSTN